jgi:hypothetical protein
VVAAVTAPGDVDHYSFTIPSGAGRTLTVTLQTSGLSFLRGKLSLFDGAGRRLLRSVASPGPLSGDLSIRLDGVKPGTSYLVRVEAVGGAPFDFGAYRLGVAAPPAGQAGVDSAEAFLNEDGHSNDSLSRATTLPQKVCATDARFDYITSGSLHNSADVDHYRIKAPRAAAAGAPTVMTVSVWTLSGADFRPQVKVYDDAGVLVAVRVLVNAGGTFTAEVAGAEPNAPYHVRVFAPAGSPARTGNYQLTVDFTTRGSSLAELAAGQLTAERPEGAGAVTAHASGIYSFVLSATGGDAVVVMTLLDAEGRTVLTLRAEAGEAGVSAALFLHAGDYTVRFTAVTSSGGAAAPTGYDLLGQMASDTIGPRYTGTSSTSDKDSVTYVSSTGGGRTYIDIPYYF